MLLAVSDELYMCRVLENQITYDGKHVPSRALCTYRGTALNTPRNSKYAIICEKTIVLVLCVYNPSRKNLLY